MILSGAQNFGSFVGRSEGTTMKRIALAAALLGATTSNAETLDMVKLSGLPPIAGLDLTLPDKVLSPHEEDEFTDSAELSSLGKSEPLSQTLGKPPVDLKPALGSDPGQTLHLGDEALRLRLQGSQDPLGSHKVSADFRAESEDHQFRYTRIQEVGPDLFGIEQIGRRPVETETGLAGLNELVYEYHLSPNAAVGARTLISDQGEYQVHWGLAVQF